MSEADLIAPLRAEEARLDAELRKLPLYRRLDAVRLSIRALSEVYGERPGASRFDSGASLAEGVESKQTKGHRGGQRGRRRPREGSLTTKVSAVAAALFRETDRRFQSMPLLKELQRRGIEQVRGKKPQSALASILSHHELFDNTRDQHGVGYGLREWSDSQPGHAQIAIESQTAPAEQEDAA